MEFWYFVLELKCNFVFQKRNFDAFSHWDVGEEQPGPYQPQ